METINCNQDLIQHTWDSLSLSVVAFAGFPAIAFLLTGDAKYAWFALGIAGTERISNILKDVLVKINKNEPMLLRPNGAKDCDIMNKNGIIQGTPGMPSAHVSLIVFFFVYAWIASHVTGVSFGVYVAVASLICALIAASRLQKKCHSYDQVFGGASLGALLAIIWKYLGSVMSVT